MNGAQIDPLQQFFIHFFLFEGIMRPLKLNRIKGEKTLYLIEMVSPDGQTRDEWLEKEAIQFLQPDFFDKTVGQNIRKNLKRERDANTDASENAAMPMPQKKSKRNDKTSNRTCPHCGQQFNRADHCKAHINKQHLGGKENIICPKCSSVFGYKSNFTQHMVKKHQWTADRAKKEYAKINSMKEQARDGDERETHVRTRSTRNGGHSSRIDEIMDNGTSGEPMPLVGEDDKLNSNDDIDNDEGIVQCSISKTF